MDSLKKLEKNDMKYIFFDIDGTLTDNTTGKIVPSAQEALDKLQENTIDSEINYHNLENIYKIYISIPASEETRLTLKDTLGSLRFEQEYLMFQPDDKKQGIVDMIAMIKGNIDDVVVFGDDYNDLVMFDERFYRIAMGNACDELKAKADYITDRNTSDGIYNACRVHGWIK